MNDEAATPTPPLRTTGGGWSWQPPEPAALQEMLAQFEVHELIGRGGMGAVYKGIQCSLNRPVAIKVLPPAIELQDPAFAERFKNEARLMARLNHPAIVSVFDFGRTAEGQLYFVMEFVDGTDVQRMIAREGRLPPEHALAIAAHLCDALGYAHKNGIVHRDIKPSNVLIDVEGRVKVADFGLAKVTGDPLHESGLTQTGMAMGTPDYVAPEALMLGVELDGRADLYSVGVMLYQMLTGDIPRGVFKMPSHKFCSIDPRFDDIVRRALEHDRDERYQSSLELRQDLDIILTTPLVAAENPIAAALPKPNLRPSFVDEPPPPQRTVVPDSPNAVSTLPSHFAPGKPQNLSTPPHGRTGRGGCLIAAVALTVVGWGGWYFLRANPWSGAWLRPFMARSPNSILPTPGSPAADNASDTAPTAAANPAREPQVERQLRSLEEQFQNKLDQGPNAALLEARAALNTSYLNALNRSLGEATRAGRLDEGAALQQEKQRMGTQPAMPAEDPPGLHSTLVKLRHTYRAAERGYTHQRDAAALTQYDEYLASITRLESDLGGSNGKDRAALEMVRAKILEIKARRNQCAARVPSGTQPLPAPRGTLPTSPMR